MATQHFHTSDRYMTSYDAGYERYFGTTCKKVYDRHLELFTYLPVVVVQATPFCSLVALFSGSGVYSVLACAIDNPEKDNIFYSTVLSNLGDTHKTERVAETITKVRKVK